MVRKGAISAKLIFGRLIQVEEIGVFKRKLRLSSIKRTTIGEGRPLMSGLSFSLPFKLRSSLVVLEYGDKVEQPLGSAAGRQSRGGTNVTCESSLMVGTEGGDQVPYTP